MADSASISAALARAKVILDLLEGANDAQLAMRISNEVANLQRKLIDVQQQVMALENEAQGLRDEVRQLKARDAETGGRRE